MARKPADITTTRKPWYAEGLQFECQPDCGACCTNHDDYAYVYLEGDDLERLADLLKLTPEECAERYTMQDDGYTVLRMDEPECPFLEGSSCGIYLARPAQCSTFPFWKENLKSPRAWRRVCEFCPGIDKGEAHPLVVIQNHLSSRRFGD